MSAQIGSFLHFNGFFSTFLALGLTYVPVVGGVIGFFGAKDVWGWVWWQAALLCFGPFIFIAALMALTSIGAAGAAAFQGARRRVRPLAGRVPKRLVPALIYLAVNMAIPALVALNAGRHLRPSRL